MEGSWLEFVGSKVGAAGVGLGYRDLVKLRRRS